MCAVKFCSNLLAAYRFGFPSFMLECMPFESRKLQAFTIELTFQCNLSGSDVKIS